MFRECKRLFFQPDAAARAVDDRRQRAIWVWQRLYESTETIKVAGDYWTRGSDRNNRGIDGNATILQSRRFHRQKREKRRKSRALSRAVRTPGDHESHSELLTDWIAPIVYPAIGSRRATPRGVMGLGAVRNAFADPIAPVVNPRVVAGRTVPETAFYGGRRSVVKALTDLISPLVNPRVRSYGASAKAVAVVNTKSAARSIERMIPPLLRHPPRT